MKSKRVKKHAKHVRRLKMAIRKYTQAQTLQSESSLVRYERREDVRGVAEPAL